MSSLKEFSIREYISKIDFVNDDWKISQIKEDMRRFLGERPAINVFYVKDVMLNEVTSEAKEIKRLNKISITFTDLDEHYKTIELIIN